MSAPHYGDFPASHTALCMLFDSFAAATGASSATSNFASSDILIYKDGGTTQRTSANGITVSTSFDSQTGLQMVVIDLSDNTDAGFYAAGHEYQVGVADVTIDAQTVRFWLGTFSIERAGGALALLKATGSVKVDAVKIAGATVDATAAQLGVNVVNWKGSAAPAMTGDAFARLGAPAGASTAADIAAVKGVLPAALVGGRIDASIGAVASGVIAAASFAANALDAVWSTATRLLSAGTNIVLAKGTGLTGLNDLSAAQVNAEADTALADVGLTTAVTGRIDVAVSSRLATAGYTAPLDAAGVRTAVGLAAANLDTQLAAQPTNAQLATALAAADDAVLAAIAALNNLSAAGVRTELATELARLDAAISSRSTYAGADTSGTTTLLARLTSTRAGLLDNLANLPSDPADQSLVIAATNAIVAAIAALNNLSAAQVNAEVVDALVTDTYAEPGQGAPAATLSLAGKIGYLFKAWRNKTTQDATDYKLYADDAATVDQKAAVSDSGSVFTRGEIAGGP